MRRQSSSAGIGRILTRERGDRKRVAPSCSARTLLGTSIAAAIMIVALILIAWSSSVSAATCEQVVRTLNKQFRPHIDEAELTDALRSLNVTGNRELPPKFVTKSKAKQLGWRPGTDLWSNRFLVGKSIGGDIFSNREGRLPNGARHWREADLDYRGGKRGAKRLVFSDDGLRMVTVNHYGSFKEVPPCE